MSNSILNFQISSWFESKPLANYGRDAVPSSSMDRRSFTCVRQPRPSEKGDPGDAAERFTVAQDFIRHFFGTAQQQARHVHRAPHRSVLA